MQLHRALAATHRPSCLHPPLQQILPHSGRRPAYNRADRHEDSLRLCQEGLNLARSLPARVAMADWLGMSGDAYYGLGRYRESVDALRSALPVFRDRFMGRHYALCLLKMGYAYQAMGDCQAAIDRLEESLDLFRRLKLSRYAERARETLDACLSSQRSAAERAHLL